jgi:hypothetical protein
LRAGCRSACPAGDAVVPWLVTQELADVGADVAGSQAMVVVLALVVVPCAVAIAQEGDDVPASVPGAAVPLN